MPTLTQMPCPRCGVDLRERTIRVVTMHGCPRCGGVWLDKEQSRKVLERVAALPVVLAAERIAREAASPPRTDGTPRCPLDAEPLSRVERDGVEIDVCPLHGAWFDAGEARRIANAGVSNDFAPDAPRLPRKPDDYTGPDAGDVLDVTIDVIAELLR